MEHIVFLTGRLAQASLERVLAGIADAPFTWEVREIGLQVAALMTAEMIRRRVVAPIVTGVPAVRPANVAVYVPSPLSTVAPICPVLVPPDAANATVRPPVPIGLPNWSRACSRSVVLLPATTLP